MSFFFDLLDHNVATEDMVWFLTQMHRHFGRKLMIIWDRSSVHRAASRHFQAHHPDWFVFEELPAYCPELNPVEQCWKHVKYDDLANFIPNDVAHLNAEASESLASLRDDQAFLRSTFAYCELAL